MNESLDLRSIIFTDGKILSYNHSKKGLTLNFRDYSEHEFELRFIGSVKVENNDGVGYEFADSRLISKQGRSRLELLNDEAQTDFAVEFEKCIVTFKNDSCELSNG